MNIVLLFSGQGAQSVGMGKDLIEASPRAKSLLDEAQSIVGSEIIQTMLEGPIEKLTRTSMCQPALYLHGIMLLELLKEQHPQLKIAAAAGLSLGEWTAHAAAETFTFREGLELVAYRGRLMEQAAEETNGSMVAMIGGDQETISTLATETGVEVANLNAPGQIVLSGTKENIAKAIQKAEAEELCACKELQVAGAYHSSLMSKAEEKMAEKYKETPLNTPRFPVYSNFTANPVSEAEEIRSALIKQITGTVRWSESLQNIIKNIEKPVFLELGPGKVLRGLMRRIDRKTKVTSIETWGDLAKIDLT